MDGETLITLIIIVIGVLWNLVVKMREKMTLPDSTSPWSEEEEQEEVYYSEDLSPYTIVEEEKVQAPFLRPETTLHDNSYLVTRAQKKEEIPEVKTIQEPVRIKRRPLMRGIPKGKLKQAIVWSEILAPPLSLRSEK